MYDMLINFFGQICIFYALNVGLALDIPLDARKFPISTYLGYAYLSAIGKRNKNKNHTLHIV